ncbi:MAG: hypothetical protein GY918_07550 [Gammaproteobacteria bacterium]|jgi:hypothetical protein|nr:hypothetical protein [Gammaproteobacteria bacterium]MDP6165043.1 hypothetical protein [Gammaproteobacteria bacterium]
MSDEQIHEVDEKTRKSNLRIALIIGLVAVIGMLAPYWALKEITGQ